jgi:hypothetical protein
MITACKAYDGPDGRRLEVAVEEEDKVIDCAGREL